MRIIVVCGKENVGKTACLNEVRNLRDASSKEELYYYDEGMKISSGDVISLSKYKNPKTTETKSILIGTAGDYEELIERLLEVLEKLIEEGTLVDVVIVACRTKGGAYDHIEEYVAKHECEFVRFRKGYIDYPDKSKPSSLLESINRAEASAILDIALM